MERATLAVLLLVAALAAASGGGWRAVLGVAGGGVLVAVSYLGIRSGVDALIARQASGDQTSRYWSAVYRLVKFVTRFAILGVIAYVMIVRLRARPEWMLAGASSLPAAVAIEAVRAMRGRT